MHNVKPGIPFWEFNLNWLSRIYCDGYEVNLINHSVFTAGYKYVDIQP